jgi:hypothetical protein
MLPLSYIFVSSVPPNGTVLGKVCRQLNRPHRSQKASIAMAQWLMSVIPATPEVVTGKEVRDPISKTTSWAWWRFQGKNGNPI